MAQLLPHTMPARFLTEIIAFTSTSIEAVAVIPFEHPLVTDAGAPAFLGIECGAQAAAALEALLRGRDGTPVVARIGHLVRISEAAFLVPRVPAGRPLAVSALMNASAPPLAIYSVTVRVDGTVTISATLSTYSS